MTKVTNPAHEDEIDNIAESIARHVRGPIQSTTKTAAVSNLDFPLPIEYFMLPPGWALETRNLSEFLPAPARKKGKLSLTDADSFIAYVKAHGSLSNSSVWCNARYDENQVDFTAILNDHGEDETSNGWRDHIATFRPLASEEWKRWTAANKKTMTQLEFAAFVEENLADFAARDGSPSGAEMLEMATNFEATQDMRFKSATRLQNGGVNLSFVQDDDDATLSRMSMFDRFAIGIPVYRNGDGYALTARLRYRVKDARLTFWYELTRPDKVLQAASETLIERIRTETGSPFFYGNPGI